MLIQMALHANDVGKAWPSLAILNRRTAFSERAVRYALRKLEETRWIVVEPRPGRTAIYRPKAPTQCEGCGADIGPILRNGITCPMCGLTRRGGTTCPGEGQEMPPEEPIKNQDSVGAGNRNPGSLLVSRNPTPRPSRAKRNSWREPCPEK